MSTLIVDRKNARLSLEGQSLVLFLNGVRQRTLPIALLERVVLMSRTELDTGLIGKLAEAGVSITLVNARWGERRALILGAGHHDVRIRLQHYRCTQDADWSLAWARQLVQGKLAAELRFLDQALAGRPDQRRVLWPLRGQLAAILPKLPAAETLDSLRGLEGSAARLAFQGLRAVVPPALGFVGRRRRPPPDPVNAALSLAYTLVHARAVEVAHAQGLDPLLGFYHQPSFGRESLASDLIEPWRPRVNTWVWRLFADRVLQAEDFHLDSGCCLLGKEGRERFYRAFTPWVQPVQRALRWQVRALVRALLATAAPAGDVSLTWEEDDEPANT